MKVLIGSARIDENGRISGGQAGDQRGGEVATQNWYRHSKGWVLLRCTVGGMARYIAEAMEAACKNDNIGYDQSQNQSLWKQVQDRDYDPARASSPTETDCARLIRVCVQHAILKSGAREGYVIPDFYTATLANVLVKSGMFRKLTQSKYVDRPDYLRRGDILVTRTKGHTVAVLSDGERAGEDGDADAVYALGDRILRNGMVGADVRELQAALISLGHNLTPDGDFGDATEMAVRAFQQARGIGVDGEVGPETLTALGAAQAEGSEEDPAGATLVEIFGGSAYVRDAPKVTGEILGTVHRGDALPYGGRQSADGWNLIRYEGGEGWVSGKYSRLSGGKLVRIVGGKCNVRAEPNTSGAILGVAHEGDTLPYLGEARADGWRKVRYQGGDAWVSGKYAVVVG